MWILECGYGVTQALGTCGVECGNLQNGMWEHTCGMQWKGKELLDMGMAMMDGVHLLG